MFDKMIEINLKSAFRLTQLDRARDVRTRLRLHHQYLVHLRRAAAVRRPALQHDQSRAHHDDAILRAGIRAERRARECDCARIDPDGVERILLEGRSRGAKSALEQQPIRHLGQPMEIAEVALLLASDRSSFMTGQTLVVDGGRLLSSM